MSEAPIATTSEDAVTSTISSLTELIAALSAALDEQSILAATMKYLARFAPHEARLLYLHLDAQGAAAESQTVAMWRDGQSIGDSTEFAQVKPLAQNPMLRGLIEKPEDLLHVDEAGANLPGDYQALALLRLRNQIDGGWQGVLALYWQTPHTFSAEERSAYRLLSFGLAMYMNGLRSRRELGEALGEAALLHEVTKQLNIAMSLDEVLRALTLPAPMREVAEVTLCSIETDASGAPAWLTVMGSRSTAPDSSLAIVGARFYLPDIPFAKLYVSSPDVPLLISDIQTDPRVDEYARQLYGATGARATIVMALTLQGRWVGLFNITWRQQVPLGLREQRIYQGLAKQAALLVDNGLMLERLRSSLAETQQQGAILRNILDHIPVGVALMDGHTAQPLLGNAYLDRLLGRKLEVGAPANASVDLYRFMQPGTDRLMAVEDTPSQRALRSHQMETSEMDILHPSAERISVESTAVPILDEGGALKNIIVVLSDLTVRKRAEQDRAKLQEEIIRVQAAALAERSSPLIPITDEILVLPLIGSIDTERGNQVLDTVLHGTSQRGAKVAIIDITGVRTVDTQAAAALTNAAQALRLLGVEPVLTGIRPEVAQTLVGLGVRLDGIITRSTLQSGIQYAQKRLNKRAIS